MSPAHPHGSAFDVDRLLAERLWLARFARALVANPADVDDVVQQTWANALARPPAHATNLRGWLGTIARNVVRSGSRSDRARVAREELVPPPPPVTDPHEAVERTELRRRVVEAVLALAEPYRTTVILRFLEEQEVVAVARTTKTNEETVRTRIRRGVERVREALKRGADASATGPEERTAARALLLAGLRDLAASAGAPPISGGGGGGGGAASRELARSGRRLATRAASRRLVLAALTVAAAGGGVVWWRVAHPATPEVTPVATRTAPPAGPEVPGPSIPPPPSPTAERSPAVAPSNPPTPTPEPAPGAAPPPEKGAKLHGVVTDPADNPVAGAYVWAIVRPDFTSTTLAPAFGVLADEAAGLDAAGERTPNWFLTRTQDDGSYEVARLPKDVGWVVGAFDPASGAMISPVQRFDRDHDELEVDVKLVPGVKLRGVVNDDHGTPLGNAYVTLYTRYGEQVLRSKILTASCGDHVGEFDVGFRCGDALEIDGIAPGFLRSSHDKIPFQAKAEGVKVTLHLERRPGVVVRGRIVDPERRRIGINEMLYERLTTTSAVERPLQILVRAVPTANGAGGDAVVGRVDFVEDAYDVVVPDGFGGALELSIAGTVVGRAPLVDLAHPPDLPCDVNAIPADVAPTTFAARYIDAQTRQPIDLSHLAIPPIALYGGDVESQLRGKGSDPQHGVINYGCLPGDLVVEAIVHGYEPGLFHVVVPPGGQREPKTFELESRVGDVKGRVLHADGRPFAAAVVMVYRVTPAGCVDVTGMSVATNSDGDFAFLDLAGGEHVVVASGLPDEASGSVRVVPADPPSEVVVRCAAGSPVLFRLSAAGSRDAKPASWLRIVDSAGVVVDATDHVWTPKKRSFDEYSALLRDGRYTVVIGRVGFKEKTVEVDVPTRAAVDVALEPLPSGPR